MTTAANDPLPEIDEKPLPTLLLPLAAYLILEECKPVDQIGLIIVPEAHQKILNQGIVVDKGPFCSDMIQLADIVFFGQHCESRLNFRGRKFIVVAENDCLGLIRGAKVDTSEPSAIIKP